MSDGYRSGYGYKESEQEPIAQAQADLIRRVDELEARCTEAEARTERVEDRVSAISYSLKVTQEGLADAALMASAGTLTPLKHGLTKAAGNDG